MSIKINFKKNIPNKSSLNLVIFADEKFNTSFIKKYINSSEFSYINDLIKVSDLDKNLLVFELSSKRKIVLVSIKKNIESFDIENLGAEFFGRINDGKKSEYFINSESIISKNKNFIEHFLHGLKLRSYKFNKYKSKQNKKSININVFGKKNMPSNYSLMRFKALEEGTFYARDLVSEL